MRDKYQWIPFLGFLDLHKDAVKELNLNPQYKWRVFAFDWFNFGFIFFGWAVGEESSSK